MMMLKQSTAAKIPFFMRDSTDSISGKTGLAPAVTLSKDGAAFGAAGGSVVEIGNGWYYLSANTTDTGTLGALLLHATASGADAWDDANQVLVDIPGGSSAEITAIKAKTDNLPSDPADASDIAASFATVNSKLDAIDDYVDSEVAAIKAKTDNLPSDPADASDVAAAFSTVNSTLATIASYIDTEVAAILAAVDTEVAAIKAKTDNLPSDPADASDIAASFVTVNSKLDAIDDYVDTEVAAIKAKTDNLPSDPADASDIAAAFATVNSKLDTIDDFVDTEVAAIKAKTDQLSFTAGNVHANAQVVADKTGYSLADGQLTVKKNQALAGFEFPMTDNVNHDLVTGLTVTARRSINGGALAACANAVVEISNGLYKIDLAAADLNGDSIALLFTAPGADSLPVTILTQA